MPQEGAMLMSRLEMVSPTRAKIVMEGLYKDLDTAHMGETVVDRLSISVG